MEWQWTDSMLSIRDWARKYAREVVLPEASKHAVRKIESSFLKQLSADGWMTLVVPEELGGMGLSAREYALALREISKACGSVGVTLAVTNMIADILVREGTDVQRKRFLEPLVRGETLTASFCLTENGSGSDASRMQTTVKKLPDGSYQISGEKIFVTNGAFSQLFLVMARHAEEDPSGKKKISAFFVPREAKGVIVGKEEDKMGLIGSSTIRMSFDQVAVPAENLVVKEGEGFKIAMRALDGGRISVASQALGIAEASLDAGIRYAKEREAFGHHLSDFQAIQWKIADAATALAAAEALIFRAAYLKDQKRSLSREASQAKLWATESAIRVCDDMIQILGGYGYIKEYPVERYFRDVRVTALYEGTSEIQRLVIARALLNE